MIYRTLLDGSIQDIYLSEKTDWSASYDLIVVGLGTAGTMCAITAAESGLHVLGVEIQNAIGGSHMQGQVNSYYQGVPGGRFEEFDTIAKERSHRLYRRENVPFAKQHLWTQALHESKVNVDYRSAVTGAYLDGTRVVGVSVIHDGQCESVQCKWVCDSTADGYFLRQLGVPYMMGRETDGTSVPYSYNNYAYRGDEIVSINRDAGYIDQYDEEDFSYSILKAQAAAILQADERTIRMTQLAGIREGMRFKGLYTMTLEDAVAGKVFPDTLLWTCSDIDCHGEDHAFCNDTYKDWYIHSNMSTVSIKMPLPIRCVIPEGVAGVVSACRCLSLDHYLAGAIRMNRDMQRLGECVGVAVAMAVQSGIGDLTELPIPVLQKQLNERGCFDSNPDKHYGFERRHNEYLPITWLTDGRDILKELATDCPGVAIQSVCRMENKTAVSEILHEAMQTTEDPWLRQNCAIALGTIGDRRALPCLRKTIESRTDRFFMDGRRSNQLPAVIAISLCGRMQDADAVDIILPVLSDAEYDKEMYHTHLEDCYKFSTSPNFNMLYFQHVSFALVALHDIGNAHKSTRARIMEAFKSFIKRFDVVKKRILIVPKEAYVVQVDRLAQYAEDALDSWLNA